MNTRNMWMYLSGTIPYIWKFLLGILGTIIYHLAGLGKILVDNIFAIIGFLALFLIVYFIILIRDSSSDNKTKLEKIVNSSMIFVGILAGITFIPNVKEEERKTSKIHHLEQIASEKNMSINNMVDTHRMCWR